MAKVEKENQARKENQENLEPLVHQAPLAVLPLSDLQAPEDLQAHLEMPVRMEMMEHLVVPEPLEALVLMLNTAHVLARVEEEASQELEVKLRSAVEDQLALEQLQHQVVQQLAPRL